MHTIEHSCGVHEQRPHSARHVHTFVQFECNWRHAKIMCEWTATEPREGRGEGESDSAAQTLPAVYVSIHQCINLPKNKPAG